MEFKIGGDRVEIDLQRDGPVFVHGGMLLHMSEGLWLEIDGRKHKVTATKIADVWWIHVFGHTLRYEVIEPGAVVSGDDGGLTAPMPGKILEVLVSVGQEISAGDVLMVMEAMKMEHKIVSGGDGIVDKIHYNIGDQVEQGIELITLK